MRLPDKDPMTFSIDSVGAMAGAARIGRRAAALIALAALQACSVVLLPPNVTPVVPLAQSVAQADNTLEEVKRDRAAIEARYAAAEQVCYAKFFVNNCLDKAKEERRSKLAVLNALENDAQYFKRKASVDQRDRELAQAEKEFAIEEAKRAAEVTPPRPQVKPLPPPRGNPAARQAAQKEREAKQAAQDQARDSERAGKIAAFEKKQADAKERQKRVAEKVAAKAAKQGGAVAPAPASTPTLTPASTPTPTPAQQAAPAAPAK
jgi:hypothetical protein